MIIPKYNTDNLILDEYDYEKRYEEESDDVIRIRWFTIHAIIKRRRIKHLISKKIIKHSSSVIWTNKNWKQFKQTKKWNQTSIIYFPSVW